MMNAASQSRRSRIVLIVGVDLDDTSEHLLRTVKELTRGVDEAEVHVVHVVPAETLNERLSEPILSPWHAEQDRSRVARWQIEQLCRAMDAGAGAHVVVHTPTGQPVEELARLARRFGADAIIVEAHEGRPADRRPFHKSVAAGLAQSAPCSVLTVRAHHPTAAPDAAAR